MKLYYVKINTDWEHLQHGCKVKFTLPTEDLDYKIFVYPSLQRYFLDSDIIGNYNGEIFNKLDIEQHNFVKNILGYSATGDFPEVRSIDDLKKVIKALDDECVKKFGLPGINKFKVGDKVKILDRVEELNLFPTKKHYQLNFNY